MTYQSSQTDQLPRKPQILSVEMLYQDEAIRDLEQVISLSLGNVAKINDRTAQSVDLLVKDYAKLIGVLAQLVDKIERLDTKLAKLSEDNNLWGSVLKSDEEVKPKSVQPCPTKSRKKGQ